MPLSQHGNDLGIIKNLMKSAKQFHSVDTVEGTAEVQEDLSSSASFVHGCHLLSMESGRSLRCNQQSASRAVASNPIQCMLRFFVEGMPKVAKMSEPEVIPFVPPAQVALLWICLLVPGAPGGAGHPDYKAVCSVSE